MCLAEFCGASDYCKDCVNNPNSNCLNYKGKGVFEMLTLQKFASVFDESTVFYVHSEEKVLDKKSAKHITKSIYADYKVVFSKIIDTGIRVIVSKF